MVTTDPIADMLIRIKNGYLARKTEVVIPFSKVKENILKALEIKGYIKNVKKSAVENKAQLKVELVYDKNKPALTEIIRVSRPSVRVYTQKDSIPRILGGLGTVIVSTPQGIMTGEEARKKGLGGEIICKVW
ncbi:30S ribosomal protein S8 [Candidatus Gottesmanbacteria bacterium]|nr:30S ribosomal protein S8 [Candidatus Gottesmanbacteria bacterium]